MKFLLDMPISPKTEEFLKKQGYDAIRVDKLKMHKSTDKEIFNYAIERNMVIITADLDFGKILAYFKSSKPSVIIFRLRYPSPESINKLLWTVLPRVRGELEAGSLILIEDDRIRIKKLPIE